MEGKPSNADGRQGREPRRRRRGVTTTCDKTVAREHKQTTNSKHARQIPNTRTANSNNARHVSNNRDNVQTRATTSKARGNRRTRTTKQHNTRQRRDTLHNGTHGTFQTRASIPNTRDKVNTQPTTSTKQPTQSKQHTTRAHAATNTCDKAAEADRRRQTG